MLGLSVTQRINGISTFGIPAVKQPRGGYINPKHLDAREFTAGKKLHDTSENVHASIIGTAVDYLTRTLSGTPVETAFRVSLAGASRLNRENEAIALTKLIKELDDTSITAACRLANFDAVFRAGVGMPGSRLPLPTPESIAPDKITCDNIRIMVERSLTFFDEYGPVIIDGMTFAGGYTETVSSGDGDFMTAEALWDFKTNKSKPTSKHTLQVLMYWLMGLHSHHSLHYENIKQLGFFNPRRGEISTIDIHTLDHSMLHEVEVEVIGYEESEAIYKL